MAEYLKNERILDFKRWLSSIDGHHTWGASVGFAFDNPGTKLPVYRLSVTAEEALSVSREWSTANGFEAQDIDAKKSLRMAHNQQTSRTRPKNSRRLG
jgi:hypothetical protein